jgi:hypothetical protein
MVSAAVCRSRGTLMAQPLLRHTSTTGALCTPAKLSPVWKSLALVAPSPNQVRATMSSFLMRAAQAAPTACGIWVAMGALMER